VSLSARTNSEPAPFLAREAFYWLTLATPVITLLIAQQGDTRPSLERAAGCLLSTWFCTVLVGLLLHVVVNAIAPRIFARVSSAWTASIAIAAIGAFVVSIAMRLLLPRLAWLDVNLAGPLGPFILRGLGVGAVYVAGARLYTWLGARARVAAERAKESELRAQSARLSALQAQLNPHFLFNTLNAIASLIPTEPERAEATVERLAGVLSYSIASGARGSVRLGEELSAVRDYLDIEQARFGERLRARIDVDDALADHLLPPMLLQPLVENAVLHGISQKPEGGEVRVRGRVEEDAMVLTVSDDGVGPGGSKRHGNGTALANLRERLALRFGGAAAFEVRARNGGGFECELRLPRGGVA
jgi:signal transduction histidine kinase